ncbi:Small nuclear ribonucleoprotein Sm D3 [Thelohanellus kitauei]|uniref:Small nuclear ribonucleoprotein Sm D3 n=1 Tax=Thelohanellus kitauei TaxID=669202 RepID=A0A0C2MUL6_THEKT|nr:Small nuclear ribonucleoprotein Sm D3 [Thelohanellus kitauei]
MSIGIPIKILHEAEGHIVTVESDIGQVYRGKLIAAEDNMNCQLINVTVTAKNGKTSHAEQLYIRGSKIKFFILPDMLKNAPMFKRMVPQKTAVSIGRGKSAILKAQVAAKVRGADFKAKLATALAKPE